MKFGFIIMGPFRPETDRAVIADGGARITGVSDIDQACREAVKMYEDGVECIELCGAFGETGARKVMEAVNGRAAIGYVVHLPEQDELYKKLFG